VDNEEVHARLAALVVAEEGGEHGRVAHHDQRQQRPQQRELLRLCMQQAKHKQTRSLSNQQCAKSKESGARGSGPAAAAAAAASGRPPRALHLHYLHRATTRRHAHLSHSHY
jgi:hypothetical protein